MRWYFAGLLPLLCLVVLVNACPLGLVTSHGDKEVNSTNTLARRVRVGGDDGTATTPKKITDLFLLYDGPGGCVTKESTFDEWLAEVILLHKAITEAYATRKGNFPLMLMWSTWFGVKVDHNTKDVDVKDVKNAILWKAIGDHISRVSKFLAGGGLTDYEVSGEKPRLFCGAEAGIHQPWAESVVKDHKGKDVVTARDPDTKEPTEYLNLGKASPRDSRNPKANAFWMSAFNGYDIDFKGETSLCADKPKSGGLRYAKTALAPVHVAPIWADGAKFAVGKTNGHILFCPPAFSPDKGFHSYSSLTKAVETDNYPEAGVKDASKALDKLMPVSATLYHEIYHLTDPANTADEGYTLDTIIQNAADKENEGTRVANSHNPETYAFFATAAYLFFAAPLSREQCVYLEGFPRKASNPFVDPK
ncbi:hypothetical protein N7471_003110 [Penicillium samsonianum]|uniref:uncharacterized protein n=1 Tax=Penicillium samsonianum TaxID=1882272 RepID=UPI002547E245|nr:uncharacterized protein N7471_003110 [Penicillium samsonianum]KAJ6143657.1 hypothetical protein N7471_003110 [Penicillium samsonianum]